MTKGTPSFGKKNKRNHLQCPRCGNMAFHKQKAKCASCAFPEAKKRTPASLKAFRRCKEGTGAMRYIKRELRKARSGRKTDMMLKRLLA